MDTRGGAATSALADRLGRAFRCAAFSSGRPRGNATTTTQDASIVDVDEPAGDREGRRRTGGPGRAVRRGCARRFGALVRGSRGRRPHRWHQPWHEARHRPWKRAGSTDPVGRRSGSGRPASGRSAGSGSRRAPGQPRGTSRRSGNRNRWQLVSISILAVLTLLVVIQTAGPSTPSAPAAVQEATGPDTDNQSAPDSTTATRGATTGTVADNIVTTGPVPDPNNRDADGHLAASIAAGALPAGADFLPTGGGTWHVVPGTSPTVGTGPGTRPTPSRSRTVCRRPTDTQFAAGGGRDAGRPAVVDRGRPGELHPDRHRGPGLPHLADQPS